MKIYLVGGAVRDALLGRPVHERDYVVVGARPEAMIALGYQQVGRDFPVFLHPRTRAEYALARTELKTGTGYHGFSFNTGSEVTLEADLQRRDLTINAIAQAEDGELIDPYGGRLDLDARVLRHVSPAFAEDPLRVLRVARFAARYAALGFKIAPETLSLMRELSHSGELCALTPERIWLEFYKAFSDPEPALFFEVLREVGALNVLLPEVDRLWGIPNPERWHPEIDTGIHTMMVLRCASQLSTSTRVRFAALVHDVGKALSPVTHWPSHHGHEEKGVPLIEDLCRRLKIPNDHRDLAVLCSRHHLMLHRGFQLRAATVLRVLSQADALRRPDRFIELLLACESDFRGRLHFQERAYPQHDFWLQALAVVRAVSVQPLLELGLQGVALAQQVAHLRSQALSDWRATLVAALSENGDENNEPAASTPALSNHQTI